MGLSNISRFCIAFLFAPSLVFANEVRVGVSPTTSHYVIKSDSISVPPKASVSASTAVSPVITKTGSNFTQTMGGGVEIQSIARKAPFTARASVSAAKMATAAKAFLKSPKGNLAFFAASVGLQQLLDGVDWVMDEGSKVQKKSNGDPIAPSDYPNSYYTVTGVDNKSSSASSACSAAGYPFSKDKYCFMNKAQYDNGWPTGIVIFVKSSSFSCPAGISSDSFGCISPPILSPVSASDVDSAVDSSYVPHESDFQSLSSNMTPDSIEITSMPRLETPPVTKTIYDANGNPYEVQETNVYYDFEISNNSSTQPKVDIKTTTEVSTYQNGVLTGTSTTTSTDTSVPPETSGGGGGGATVPAVEIPTDCDFHPTLCAWMDWTKQNDLDDEPDLKQIMHDFEPTNTNFTVTGSKSCPAPYPIYVGIVGKTYDLSFEPACTFAGYLYFFVMAGAYVYAAYITLGVARNG